MKKLNLTQETVSLLLMLIVLNTLALGLFIVDLYTCNVGVVALYAVLLLLFNKKLHNKHVIYMTMFFTTLMILGHFLSTICQDDCNSIVDRLILVATMWGIAIILVFHHDMILALKNSEQKQEIILSNFADPVVVVKNHLVQYASDSISAVFGWTSTEIIGKNFTTLLAEPFATQYYEYFRQAKFRTYWHEKNTTVEVLALHKNNSNFPCEMSITVIDEQILDGLFFTIILRDISDRKHHEQKLVWLSTHDELTGIFNRRYFNERIEHEWQRLGRKKSPLALIMFDIDCFKSYNDTLGHQVGDACLKTVASVFAKIVKRAGDFAARYGGEEFVILLPNTDVEGIIDVAKKIQNEIMVLDIAHPVSPISKIITASMGLSVMIPSRACTAEVLIHQADYALYQAKDAGRDRYIVYSE